MIKRSIGLMLWFLFYNSNIAQAQASPFYKMDAIQEIRVYFTYVNWSYRLDTAASSVYESFTVARQIKINGVTFDSIGAKYKGNSTFSSNRTKNPWHFELDHIKGNQNYQGIKDIKLSNIYYDPSFVREALSFDILKNYMHCPRANFARVYVNDTLIGLYTNTEAITKTFGQREFHSNNTNPFFKCNPPSGPNGGVPSLTYINADSNSYMRTYELKSDYGWNDLVALCDTLKNKPASIEQVMDMDRVIWMSAFNALVVNLDSYSGIFGWNYYLWKDNNGRFNPIIWDMNMSFGSFTSTGTAPQRVDTSTAISLTPFLHQNNPERPLLNLIFDSHSTYRRQYVAHLKTMMTEMFLNGYYRTVGLNLQNLINSDVQQDPNKFYTYASFKPNLYIAQTGYAILPTPDLNSFPGIVNLMDKRVDWLLNNVHELRSQPPVIENRPITPATPRLNDVIWVTTRLTNATYTYVGWRASIGDIFKKTPLFDDGLHQDGLANDGVYGASFPALSPIMQYYIYAENNNAGLFSPERAEHEFHTIAIDVTPVTPITRGQLVLNEIMALNTKTALAPNGKYGDWVELHNRTNNALNIGGVTMSDDRNFLTKWRVPANTIIAPNGYLIVWGTDDSLIINDLQMNFKLTANGEALYLMAPAPVALLDSVTFPKQKADTTWARYPNGTGNWRFLRATFKAPNTLTANEEILKQLHLKIYPNPTDGFTIIESTDNHPLQSIQLFDASGRLLRTEKSISDSKTIFHWGNLPNGMYLIRVQGQKAVSVMLQR
jgi:hypothetical protein